MTMHYGKLSGNTRERRIYMALRTGLELSTRQLVLVRHRRKGGKP